MRPTPVGRPSTRSPLWLLLWIVLALLVTVALTGGIFLALQRWFPLRDDDGALFEYARTTAALTAVIGAAVLATIAVRRQVHTERAHQLDRDKYQLDRDKHEDERAQRREEQRDRRADTDRAEVLALRERYTTAAEQLGHHSPAIRLAGVHAMAALADDWAARGNDAEVQTCIDVLCGVIRIPPSAEASPEESRGELEVRQTVVRLITAHLQEGAAPGWHGKDFDFTGADFDGEFDFRTARFTGGSVSFRGARFIGGVIDFSGAKFTGSAVDFGAASFSCRAVRFRGAVFAGGSVVFDDAEFASADVDFVRARFTGARVTFADASFRSGTTELSSSRITSGLVDFTRAEVTGSIVMWIDADVQEGVVSFYAFEVADGSFRLDLDNFPGGRVTFDRARFSGGTFELNGAGPTGGRISFTDARRAKGVLTGEWTGGPAPGWPIPLGIP